MTLATDHHDALLGLLWGTALGDALGLPAEGLTGARVQKRWGQIRRFHLLGRLGVVSDDTEQAALLAHALATVGAEPTALARRYRRSLVGWLWRLPFGIGLGTLRAGLKLTLGARRGVRSAGNGAAMRAGVLGVAVADPAQRVAAGRAVAQLTHTDERAIDGALYVAELTARRAQPPEAAVRAALQAVQAPTLRDAIQAALALGPAPVPQAAEALGNTGYVLHTLALVTWAWLRDADAPFLDGVARLIGAGGDTDTTAAIFGALWGARHGARDLPQDLLAHLAPGPFGAAHLQALAAALAAGQPPPRFSALGALLRNLALYPVVLAHGFARLVW